MKWLIIVPLVIALIVGIVVLDGMLIVWVISWFGPQLALWQGIVIAFVVGGITGGTSARR